MNQVMLIGRLTKDVELRRTPNGSPVCEVTVAVDRLKKGDREKEADFIQVTVWGKSAENLAQYKGKGDQIAVEGRLTVDSYTDKDGNKRWKTFVTANRIEFIGGGRGDGKKAVASAGSAARDFGTEVSFSDEDLPF